MPNIRLANNLIEMDIELYFCIQTGIVRANTAVVIQSAITFRNVFYMSVLYHLSFQTVNITINPKIK